MGVIWYKIWFDIWHNKTRTLLTVLSIAAGVFAVGAIFGMSDMMLSNMDKSHHEVLATHINAALTTYVDRDIIMSLRDVPGVEDVEPYNSANVLYKLHPEDEWRQGVIQMRDNYEQQKYELLQLRGGNWPRFKDDIAVERMGAQSLNIGIGDSVIFKIDEKERVLPITGFIRHPFVPPPQFMDLAFFNSLVRRPEMPPLDPWMSGRSINYYYWGYLLAATLAKASFVNAFVAYNLAIATFAGFSFAAAACLGVRLSKGRTAPAIAAGFACVFAGNLVGAFDAWARPFAKDFDYWHASRVIASGDTINEFPFFTFFHADLHPHLLAFPFFLASFAVADRGIEMGK